MPKIWNLATNEFQWVESIDETRFTQETTLDGEKVWVETNLVDIGSGPFSAGTITRHDSLAQAVQKALEGMWESAKDLELYESFEKFCEGFTVDQNIERGIKDFVLVYYLFDALWKKWTRDSLQPRLED
jgi:hypothetical protein